MPLKVKVTATEYESLPDVLKSEYKLQADQSYALDLGGLHVTDKDPAGLMSALEAEREETRKAKAAADRLEQEKLESERSKITDIDALRESFRKEMEDRDKRIKKEQQEVEKRIQQQRETTAQAHKSQEALKLATEIFGPNAAIMLPHVEANLKAKAGDVPGVEFIDPLTGQPRLDQDLENFKKTLSTNPLYSPMVVISNASGGSANGGQSVKGLPDSTTADGKPKTYRDYQPGELLALKRDQPELFKKLQETKV